MIKIRFNLGAGENFMKWKVTFPNKFSRFYDPETTFFVMRNCRLVNHISGSKKIFGGEQKRVVAWIEAEEIEILKESKEYNKLSHLQFNPRKSPHWLLDGEVVDGKKIDCIVSLKNKVYKI